jgi:hypothetical protein
LHTVIFTVGLVGMAITGPLTLRALYRAIKAERAYLRAKKGAQR